LVREYVTARVIVGGILEWKLERATAREMEKRGRGHP